MTETYEFGSICILEDHIENLIAIAKDILDPREFKILLTCYKVAESTTCTELAKEMKISLGRIYNLKKRALAKLKKRIRKLKINQDIRRTI